MRRQQRGAVHTHTEDINVRMNACVQRHFADANPLKINPLLQPDGSDCHSPIFTHRCCSSDNGGRSVLLSKYAKLFHSFASECLPTMSLRLFQRSAIETVQSVHRATGKKEKFPKEGN